MTWKLGLIIGGTAVGCTTLGVVLGRTVLASEDTKDAKKAAKAAKKEKAAA